MIRENIVIIDRVLKFHMFIICGSKLDPISEVEEKICFNIYNLLHNESTNFKGIGSADPVKKIKVRAPNFIRH